MDLKQLVETEKAKNVRQAICGNEETGQRK